MSAEEAMREAIDRAVVVLSAAQDELDGAGLVNLATTLFNLETTLKEAAAQ